jgi:hypothetical protein
VLFAACIFLAPFASADDAPPTSTTQSDTSAKGNQADSSDNASSKVIARENCIHECTRANSQCNVDVRRARSQCQRSATAGSETIMSSNRDYEAFCGYFRDSRGCNDIPNSKACHDRFRQHYTQCIAAVQPNALSTGYDCFGEERQAAGMCSAELNQCKAACF